MSGAEAEWRDVGPADEIAANELRGVMVKGNRICLGRAGDDLFALEDTCPHAGGSLCEGIVDGKDVICPLHAYAFEAATGHCPDDPSCSVRRFEVRVEDGVIQVRV
ncbi:MAG: Rieske (2Fe-2S) protein [Proteobacteria bacterium]|nr:Rieske (2Fe-2S) protein [Pseudomonadota bacterium]MCZ6783247.1 Rieske (2Fe-2S) protein [Pseudomonadota bacterium]